MLKLIYRTLALLMWLIMSSAYAQVDVVSPAQVLGVAEDKRIFSHGEVEHYFNHLAAAYPDRIKKVPYARSWQDQIGRAHV